MSTAQRIAILILAILLGSMLIATAAGQDGQTSPEELDIPDLEIEIKERIDYLVLDSKLATEITEIREALKAQTAANLELMGKIDLLLQRTDADQPVQAPADSPAININEADLIELQKIPGVGPVKAGAIIAERGQSGPFSSWSDLMNRVAGVGPATIAEIQAGGAVLE